MAVSSAKMGNYFHVWQKYKPVIVKLMMDSEKKAQTYQLSDHEFRDVNPKRKTGYSFKFKFHSKRSLSNLKSKLLAEDLLSVLLHSNTASELSYDATFEFELDKDFKLHVSREELEANEEESKDEGEKKDEGNTTAEAEEKK